MIAWAVKDVKPLPDYRLEVTFADGLHGVVDLTDIPHVGVFAGWTDPAYFQQARVDIRTGAVCWPNGADVAPEVMYREVKDRRVSAA